MKNFECTLVLPWVNMSSTLIMHKLTIFPALKEKEGILFPFAIK